MSNLHSSALRKVYDGITGRNKGIPTTSKFLNKWITNIQKERIYIIAGSSGSGKTSFANDLFVFSAFDEYLKNDKYNPEIVYFSFEMTKENLIGKLICKWLYDKHDIITSPNSLFSYGDNRCSQRIIDLINSDECKEYINKFEEISTIIDKSMSPKEIIDILSKIANDNGEYKQNEKGYWEYIEHKEGKHVIVVIDHAALVKMTPGKSKKATIDELTPSLIKIRNRYKFTIIILQQLNRNISSTDRLKLDQMLPNDADLKETSDLYDGCDVCIGIFNPFKYRIPETFKYKITTDDVKLKKHYLEDRFRLMNIMKNRHGEGNKIIPVGFIGENCKVIDLKRPEEFNIFEFNENIEKKKNN